MCLCAGYDSQCLALERCKELNPEFDYDLVAWSEIDKYAIEAHDALFPQWADRNLGDMTKIDWENVPDFDLLFYSTPCFVAGTLIATAEGMKPIESISAGDMVFTHTGTLHKVVIPMHRRYKGKMIRIRAMMLDEILCTANHPFYVRKKKRVGHKWKRTFLSPEWVNAEKLDKSYYLGMPVNEGSALPEWEGISLNQWGHDRRSNTLSALFEREEFWYLMGRYVGDGWRRDDATHKGVIICCSSRNEETLRQKLNIIGFRYTKTSERTCVRYTIYSKELCEFVNRYGYRAYGKRIDAETLNLPVDLLQSFMCGYIDSDGCSTPEGYRATTVSRELAYGIVQAAAKAYWRPARMVFSHRPDTCTIEGRVVNQRDTYSVAWKFEKRKQDKAFYEDGYIWYPLREVTAYNDECDVYNMEVEDDHSYIANNATVHNCQSISQAGLQHGFTEGSGTRSSIIWNVRDALRVKRPKMAILENVRAMVSNKFVGMFNLWQYELEKFGYTNYAKVLNAKDYGVPQNRERIFLVSLLDGRFKFGEPFELKRHLVDVLEDKVDEKYYLDDRKVRTFLAQLPDETLAEYGIDIPEDERERHRAKMTKDEETD